MAATTAPDLVAAGDVAERTACAAKIYTTGAVARICQVSPRTVSQWFDTGLLRGFRIPGSQDRRIPHAALARFLRDHGMYDALSLVGEGVGVLVVGDPLLAGELAALVPGVTQAPDLFGAGVEIQEHSPATVVLCGALGRNEIRTACASLARRQPSPAVVVLAPEDWPRESWQGLGATHVLQRPVPVARLAKLLGAGE